MRKVYSLLLHQMTHNLIDPEEAMLILQRKYSSADTKLEFMKIQLALLQLISANNK